jgi:hypothetical protein
MLRFTSLAAAAALLASTGIALAQMPTYSNERQTQTYSTDRPSYSTERWNGTRSYQQSYESAPSYQHQPMNRTLEMNRFGRSQTERFGASQTGRFGTTRADRFGTAPMSGSTVEPRTTVRERGMGMAGGQFASEADARSRCGGDTVIWVNTRSHVYHFPGSPDFGHTKRGAFMCRADADRVGSFRPAKDEMRGRVGMTGSSTAPLRNSFIR